MDMYEKTLNLMYTATVFFIAFTVVIWVFDKEKLPNYFLALGWFISVVVWVASIITLIWVK